MILAILAIVTATARPAAPAVGDLITVDFPAPVVLEASQDYELLEARGKRVIVRTFEPKPFALAGTIGNVRFKNLMVPVRSVLEPKDDLKPAPLVPPREAELPRRPSYAIGIAALVAALAWLAAWLRARRRVEVFVPPIAADVRFRNTVAALRDNPHAPLRWAALADATRAFLAATRPDFGTQLTTMELLRRTNDPVIAEILRQGDLEKFAPGGAEPRDFAELATRALSLAPDHVEEEQAA